MSSVRLTSRRNLRSSGFASAGLTALFLVAACGEREGPPKIERPAASGGDSASQNEGGAPATGAASGEGGTDNELGGSGGSGGSPDLPSCPQYQAGELRERPIGPLGEASGLASSRLVTSRLYSHNDSGDLARAFVLDQQGIMQGTFSVDVPTPTDWEDMAAYLDGEGQAQLLFADIGDNNMVRDSVRLVIAPDLDDYSGAPIAATVRDLSYEDGPHNAEALFVDERDQHAYLLTKASPPRLYVVDLESEAEQWTFIAELSTFPAGFIPTAADMRAREIVVRSLSEAFIFLAPDDLSVQDAFGSEACPLTLLNELNAGEAIAFDEHNHLFTLTEHGDPLAFYKRSDD